MLDATASAIRIYDAYHTEARGHHRTQPGERSSPSEVLDVEATPARREVLRDEAAMAAMRLVLAAEQTAVIERGAGTVSSTRRLAMSERNDRAYASQDPPLR